MKSVLELLTQRYEHIEFGNTEEVELGKAIGDIDVNVVKRAQIRSAIETLGNGVELQMSPPVFTSVI